MAKTIPKLNIQLDPLHSARRKLQSLSKDGTIDFEGEERESLLALIQEAKGIIYPTKMARDRYQYQLDQIEKIEPPQNPAQFENWANQIEEFENQFCK